MGCRPNSEESLLKPTSRHRVWLTRYLLACALYLGLATTGYCQPAAGPWTQLGYDQQRTGRSHLVGPRTPYLRWTSEVSGLTSIAPAIAPDGTIVTTSYDDGGSLVTVSPEDGTTEWTFSSRDTSNATPSIGADGHIYFGDSDNWFYAVDSDGSLVWEIVAEDDVWSSPLLRNDNSVVFTTDGHGTQPFIHAVDGGTGSEVWSTTMRRGDLNHPILGINGNIFANAGGGTSLNAIRGFDADGTLLWSDTTVRPLDTDHGAVGADGKVFYGSTDGRLAAFHPTTGQRLWLSDVGDAHVMSPAIGSDGTVYAAATDGMLRAYHPDTGDVLWHFDAGLPASTRVSIDADGTVYFGAQEMLFAVTSAGAELWRFELPMRAEDTTPVIGDGVIYIAGKGGSLYAIAPEPSTVLLIVVGMFATLVSGRHRKR